MHALVDLNAGRDRGFHVAASSRVREARFAEDCLRDVAEGLFPPG